MLEVLIQEVIRVIFRYQYEVQVSLLVGLATYYLVVYPFLLSPLRNIPGPYIHRISGWPALHHQRKQNWIMTRHKLHQKYGNVVILGPKEISVNGDSKFIHDIYVKNFPKSSFYANFGNHGHPNMFASLKNDKHLQFKRILQGLYSKSAIFSPKNPTRKNVLDKISQLVDAVDISSVSGQQPDILNARSEHNEHGKGHVEGPGWFNARKKTHNLGIDVYSLFGSLAMDVVSAFELGVENGTDLLLHPEKRPIIVSHRQVASMGFWTTLMPRLWNWAASKTILQASADIEKWQLGIYANAEQNVPQVSDDSNLSTLEALKKSGLKEKAAYSFLSDNIFAGHETTAIQLTYLTYELSRPVNSGMQKKLVHELHQAFGVPGSKSDLIADLETVDGLPYLNALLDENSRVHTSIPGPEPRVVDKPYLVTTDSGNQVVVPVGTVISVQPYSMHRNESVFPNPDHFAPERWLQYDGESTHEFGQRIKLQQKYMMPFGKGVRMCLGMNLALIEMKLALANLYWHYHSALCPEWCHVTPPSSVPAVIPMGVDAQRSNLTDEEKMVMVDTYTTRPLNDECWLEWYTNHA